MEGAICIGTNLDDERTLLITIYWVPTVYWVLHPSSGPGDLFLGPKYRKIGLEKHLFCILFFLVPPSCTVFDSHGLRWAPLW